MTAVPICPECAASKHHNCDGRTWENGVDEVVYAPCPCAHTGHGDATARCDLSGLLVDQCACRIHAPQPPVRDSWRTGVYSITARFPARFDSECDACGEAMAEGDPIARTDNNEYICQGCAS